MVFYILPICQPLKIPAELWVPVERVGFLFLVFIHGLLKNNSQTPGISHSMGWKPQYWISKQIPWRNEDIFLAASSTEVGVKLVQFHLFIVRQCVLMDKAVTWQSGNWVASRTYSCASCSAKQKVWLMLVERWDEHLAQYFRAMESILDRKLASEKGE